MREMIFREGQERSYNLRIFMLNSLSDHEWHMTIVLETNH
jgi:hypothetical protein